MNLVVDMVLQCTNADCPQFGIIKNVSLLPIGDGVYAQPRIVCTCSYEMWFIGPQEATP